MFREILRIIPRLEPRDVDNMENTLGKRFARIGKKFGGGLIGAIKGGGIVGLASSLIEKVLNPIEAVRDAIDRSLNRGDDLATYAKQFGTSSGNLARLQAFGQASGLDPEGVRVLLGKFQSSVATASADPSKPSAVSQFVGRKDTAESFFEFIQSMQKLTAEQQNLVQQEVFGERQILKASEFLNADFKKLSDMFAGGPSTDQLTASAEWLALMSDNRDFIKAQKDLTDLVTKSKLINDSAINALSASDALDLKQENKQVGNAAALAALSMENQKLLNMAANAFIKLAPVITALLQDITAGQGAIKSSRVIRGMLPGAGKEK